MKNSNVKCFIVLSNNRYFSEYIENNVIYNKSTDVQQRKLMK